MAELTVPVQRCSHPGCKLDLPRLQKRPQMEIGKAIGGLAYGSLKPPNPPRAAVKRSFIEQSVAPDFVVWLVETPLNSV